MRKTQLLISFFLPLALWAGCRVEYKTMPCTLLPGVTERAYTICLPDGYDDNTDKEYPVLYLLHGGGCSNTDFARYGNLRQTMDSLIAVGCAGPMIVVCPEANEGGRMIWFNEPEWRFEDYFFQEFLPYIEKHYRVDTRREQRSIAGFSMGGGGSIGYGLRHSDMFHAVYSMSGYLRRQPLEWLKNDPLGEWRQQNVERHNPICMIMEANDEQVRKWKQVRWFIDCGDHDFTLEANMDLVKALRVRNIPYELHIKSGDHNWDYWKPAMIEAIKFCF